MGRKRVAAGAGISIGAVLGGAGTAHAQDFTVANLGNSGPGSLRQAVLDANAAGTDDRVLFSSGLSGAITLTSGQIAITDAVEIDGPGAKEIYVSGNHASRVFNVDVATAGEPVTIDGLTVTAGKTAGSGGGIRNFDSKFTLSNSNVVFNESTADAAATPNAIGGGGFVDAGGYAGGAQTRIVNSAIAGNQASYASAGGIGAVDQIGEVVNSTIAQNYAFTYAGGMLVSGVTITGSTIAGNYSYYAGGGIAITGTAGPRVALRNSLVASNFGYYGGDDLAGGETVDAAFTLVGDTQGATINATVSGSNIFNVSPHIDYNVADNGGPTLTVLPEPDSPALDKGSTGAGPATDQRGEPRPMDLGDLPNSTAAGADGADMGAVELGPDERKIADLTLEVTPSADPAFVGDPLTFTATLRNIGPDPATDVELDGYLPATLPAVISGTSPECVVTPYYDGADVECAAGTIASGGTAVRTIATRPAAGAVGDPYSGFYGYASTSTFDPNTFNNAGYFVPSFVTHPAVVVPPPPPPPPPPEPPKFDLKAAIKKCKKKFRGKKRAKCIKKTKKDAGRRSLTRSAILRRLTERDVPTGFAARSRLPMKGHRGR